MLRGICGNLLYPQARQSSRIFLFWKGRKDFEGFRLTREDYRKLLGVPITPHYPSVLTLHALHPLQMIDLQPAILIAIQIAVLGARPVPAEPHRPPISPWLFRT